MRPSYPAVTFERVCFTVDRSQQQANFLAECLSNARHCLTLGRANATTNDRKVNILKSVNLNVPTGSIFGLLGPSSCGKTTLLRCLVGLLKPSSGSISLFCQERRDFGPQSYSSRENKKNLSKVPGANVGYMPQDLGLYEDFTIRQLLTMFGQYMGMELNLIKSRIAFMADFLDLPHADRQIASLSGGQKRRVSFAIACLHSPPLIILDEPTVGVDPLLRQSIWKYLRRLANEEHKTIIITTHYIEEAAQADQVALMRAGEILVQDSPKRIMQTNGCKTLEEAFLKICNNATRKTDDNSNHNSTSIPKPLRLRPQLKFDWHERVEHGVAEKSRQVAAGELSQRCAVAAAEPGRAATTGDDAVTDSIVRRLQERAQEKLAIFEYLQAKREPFGSGGEPATGSSGRLPNLATNAFLDGDSRREVAVATQTKSFGCLRRSKLVIGATNQKGATTKHCDHEPASSYGPKRSTKNKSKDDNDPGLSRSERIRRQCRLIWALLYKNYRRNVNSLPLLAFQFLLPIVQMISFSLCIGGRPSQIGLGLVNHDQLISYAESEPSLVELLATNSSSSLSVPGDDQSLGSGGWSSNDTTELLSARYLSFLDESMLAVRPYESLGEALADVRRGKLWAAMEIGANFSRSIASRFDLENFYQLDATTIGQSVIKLYPDRSNKVLDMICQRSLVNSFRQFLLDEFEHFKRLPVEVKEPIFDIKPNLISNSMDGYTESIAAGLLASLTYIMAAGLTTFIMVVERSAGILERTYTSGIRPVAYLLAHAAFRSFVMMLQVGLVLFLTFYLLRQPLVGSIWLAYLMLMTLNLTGIAYGLLISSLVRDQNGAALTIVSSLVVKITMSGILWPFEAIPRWLRALCYVQPLTMPVQALKSITLKGAQLDDRTVYLGFVVSLTWLAVFLTISARRFKFYQH